MKKVNRIFNYVATFPHRYIRYHSSNMHLYIDSDAGYLVESKAWSRVAGYHYFKYDSNNRLQAPISHPVLVECKFLRHDVTFEVEAEVVVNFHNAQVGTALRRLLFHLGYPLKTDNTPAASFSTSIINQKRSKTLDMRFYWFKNQEAKRNFSIYWKRGDDAHDPNHADYFTKHHTTKHYKFVRHRYISQKIVR